MLGRLTKEPIFCIKQFIEKYKENKNNLTVVLIDFKQGYNSLYGDIVKVFEEKGCFDGVYKNNTRYV